MMAISRRLQIFQSATKNAQAGLDCICYQRFSTIADAATIKQVVLCGRNQFGGGVSYYCEIQWSFSE